MHCIIMCNHKHANISTILCFVLHLQYNLNTQFDIILWKTIQKAIIHVHKIIKVTFVTILVEL